MLTRLQVISDGWVFLSIKHNLIDIAGIALNVTAKEFVPNLIRDNSRPNLRPGGEILKLSPRNSICDTNTEIRSTKIQSQVIERKCVRCKKTFQTDAEGSYLEVEECRYHWGKIRSGEREQRRWNSWQLSEGSL